MQERKAKNMKGFMCHSLSSTSVCMAQDFRSAVVPRNQVRPVKYVRLGEHRAVPESIRRSPVSSLRKGEENVADQEAAQNTTATSLPICDNVFRVVVMRVSIHCQGCAAKVKKHLSKMEGVTSFSIDVASKRVTVMGHVSPSGVLESISKVKKAEIWAC